MTSHGAEIVAPTNADEACGALRDAAASGGAVCFEGGGTALDFGYPPERCDTIVCTRRMARVLEYAPSDMTVTVECGATLAALQAHLAPHGQRLALDPPSPERATIGGILACNVSGPLRARYGTARDLTLGVALVRADGTPIRGGGKVVKNVAGFDIPKLAIGSLGSLGLIVAATFRLHPLPAHRRPMALRVEGAAAMRELVRAMLAEQLEPASVVAARSRDGYDVAVAFEGFAPGCDEQAGTFARVAEDAGAAATAASGDAGVAVAHERARVRGAVRAVATFAPADLVAVDRMVLAPLAATLGGDCVVYPTVGIAYVGGDEGEIASVVAALTSARDALERGGGTLVLAAAPADVRAGVDVFGALPHAFDVMRTIKQRFDPDRRLNPGRYVGRL
jgi:glycolate dehydrogenase FAD-binding subunit